VNHVKSDVCVCALIFSVFYFLLFASDTELGFLFPNNEILVGYFLKDSIVFILGDENLVVINSMVTSSL
jgi:hypothetical protein